MMVSQLLVNQNLKLKIKKNGMNILMVKNYIIIIEKKTIDL